MSRCYELLSHNRVLDLTMNISICSFVYAVFVPLLMDQIEVLLQLFDFSATRLHLEPATTDGLGSKYIPKARYEIENSE